MAITVKNIRFYDRVYVYSINSPRGSIGSYKWLQNIVDEAEDHAIRNAPIGKNSDRYPRDRGRGPSQRYVTKFTQTPIGSNKGPRRSLLNTAPYATYVENGRRSTLYSKFEAFYSGGVYYPKIRYRRNGTPIWGTRGWPAQKVLQKAMAHAISLVGTGLYVSGFTKAVRR